MFVETDSNVDMGILFPDSQFALVPDAFAPDASAPYSLRCAIVERNPILVVQSPVLCVCRHFL